MKNNQIKDYVVYSTHLKQWERARRETDTGKYKQQQQLIEPSPFY